MIKHQQMLFLFLFSLALFSSQVHAKEGMAFSARGTGRTTGHIATLSVTNNSSTTQSMTIGPVYIPVTNPYQGYVVPFSRHIQVTPGHTIDVPIRGYGTDIYREPVPAGELMIPYEKWVGPSPVPDISEISVTPAGPYRPRPTGQTKDDLRATIPGTETALPFTININTDPETAAPFLLEAVIATGRAYNRIRRKGVITTPYSATPEQEYAAIVQQTIWIYGAELSGREYTKEDFHNRMQGKLEASFGKKMAAAPEPVQKQFNEDVDNFWDSFQLVGSEAKILAAETTPEPETPPAPIESGSHTPDKTEEHTPKEID